MIKYESSAEAIDITFRVHQSRIWHRFVINKEGIKKIWFVGALGGWVKSVEQRCDECGNISCFCPSKFEAFNDLREKYFLKQAIKEKLCFKERKENHLRLVKK